MLLFCEYASELHREPVKYCYNDNNTKFIKHHNAVRRLQRRWRNR